MWPFDDPIDPIGDLDKVIDGALSQIGGLMACGFMFVIAILMLIGKIPVPGGIIGRWVGALVSIGIGVGLLVFTGVFTVDV